MSGTVAYALGAGSGGSAPADLTPTTVFGPAVLTPTTTTAVISSAGYSVIDWDFKLLVQGAGPITALDWLFQFTNVTGAPAASDWVDVLTETIASGVGTEFDYKPHLAVGAVAPLSLGLRVRAMGLQMRAVLTVTGDPTGSSASITVVRR